MKRSYFDCKSHSEDMSKKVALVERNPEPYGLPLVSTIAVEKKSPNDLVELATEIQKADNFIRANASNKLHMIAQQVRFLQQQAVAVLQETKMNMDLHHVACNFVKAPGNTYHLYKRPSGQKYFSMLSPQVSFFNTWHSKVHGVYLQEWSSCPHEFLGSFRLEADRSWTPAESINNKDTELSLINKIMTSTEANLPLSLQGMDMDLS